MDLATGVLALTAGACDEQMLTSTLLCCQLGLDQSVQS